MNFRTWLERAMLMSPWEAVRELGLEARVGEPMDESLLSSTYRKIALETHPDRNPAPEAALRFKRAAEAYEVLRPFVGGQVPGEHDAPHPSGDFDYPDDARSEFYKELSRRMAPLGQYTMAEFEEWVSDLVGKGYFQVKNRHSVNYISWGQKLVKGEYTSPLGSVNKTFRVTGYASKGTGVQRSPRDSIVDLFGTHMSRMPEYIVDMKVKDQPNWREAWITMELPGGRYQTVSFFPVVKKERKDPSVGMKKDGVAEHLRSAGLVLAGSYTAGDNYGVSDSPLGHFVQLGSKVVRIVRRYRGDYYGKKTIETANVASEHYGKLTKELLDKYVAVVRRRSQQNESFVHDGGIDRNFVMAVYSIMYNKASATDWELIDSVPKQQALAWVRSILSDNGTEGERLDGEMGWWRKQIDSTGKWN